jgi:chemotaxis protein methyltransferase CheR
VKADPRMQIATSAADAATKDENGKTDPFLWKIRDLIYKVAGIYQPDDRIHFIAERALRRMRVRRLDTFAGYFDTLTVKAERDAELRELLNEITVGETCLFRSLPQVDALTNFVLLELMKVKSHMAQRKLRVWSAGCSTGEEAYTLAMVLTEEFTAKYPGWSFELTATDLNERSLQTAKEGTYGEFAMRNVPSPLREKYFSPVDDKFQIKPEVKARVNFTRLNLFDDTKMLFMKGMNIISCCNVLIYFDANSKRRVVQHFFSNLLPGGYLFLGQTESLHGISSELRLVHFSQATAYFRPPLSPFSTVKT